MRTGRDSQRISRVGSRCPGGLSTISRWAWCSADDIEAVDSLGARSDAANSGLDARCGWNANANEE
jgi:hypothetical protein